MQRMVPSQKEPRRSPRWFSSACLRRPPGVITSRRTWPFNDVAAEVWRQPKATRQVLKLRSFRSEDKRIVHADTLTERPMDVSSSPTPKISVRFWAMPFNVSKADLEAAQMRK